MKTNKPLIGVTPYYRPPSDKRDFAPLQSLYYSDLNYCQAVEQGGGVPLILPYINDKLALEQTVEMLDGLLLSGGDDIDPSYYHQPLYDTNNDIFPVRDSFEFKLLELFYSTGKPIFGICRGFEVLNVYLGGTLIQDIPAMLGLVHHHQSIPTYLPSHSVKLDENCLVAEILQDTILQVNSHHHQAIGEIGRGLRVTGSSEEGVPEVIEHESHPYLVGVQWHPERLGEKNRTHQKLFDHFVNACKQSPFALNDKV